VLVSRDIDSYAYSHFILGFTSGPDSGLWGEDKEALDEILPAGTNGSEYAFYCHVAELFRSRFIRHEVTFSQLALSVSPGGADVRHLWANIITGNTALGLYEDSYAAIVATPYEDLYVIIWSNSVKSNPLFRKRECVAQLVYRMCEDDAVEKLISFNFARFADEIQDALAFKARNVDPRARPFYSRILYAWFVFRGDYRNGRCCWPVCGMCCYLISTNIAALSMYQRARSLQDLIIDTSTFIYLAEEQLEAYMAAINALCLLDRKSAWIAMPISRNAGSQVKYLLHLQTRRSRVSVL
jgi:nuclear pore complex protein Nup160